jgi:hypothetical protein
MRDTFRPWPRPPRSRTPGASVTHRQGGTDHCWDRARSTEFQATPPPNNRVLKRGCCWRSQASKSGSLRASIAANATKARRSSSGGRDELAAGLQELIAQLCRPGAGRRRAATQDEQVAEFERRVDAGGGHRRLQARLKGRRICMSEEAETIVLLATGLAKKGEGQAAMQRRALLVRSRWTSESISSGKP